MVEEMRIGLDFDNTIVCYDQAFYNAALEQGLIPPELPAVKNQVRDYLRSQGKEENWIVLQGLIYGSRIAEGFPFPGVLDFLDRCRSQGACVFIISYRTKYAARGHRYNLHQAAESWLESHGFKEELSLGQTVRKVHFESTIQKKLGRIARSGCSYFVDDLPEFLNVPRFPAHVQPILFDPVGRFEPEGRVCHASSWNQIGEIIFGDIPVEDPPRPCQ